MSEGKVRFVSFFAEGRASYGIAVPGGIHDLGVRMGPFLPDLKSFLKGSALGLAYSAKATQVDYAPDQFAYLPVVPNPAKILCVGLNYEEHRKETGRPEAAYPSMFTRFADTLLGHEAAISLPAVSSALDYEGELAVIIGKPGFNISREAALGHVAGYACFNDATLRDWQRHTHQFTPGKNFPATGPFGPELVTPDEVGSLADQTIETHLNQHVVQAAKLGDMIFSVADVIAYVSSFTPLDSGDVIATGTPGGVGAKREPPLFMKAGDRVEVCIGGIGRLTNPIIAHADKG